MTPTASCDPELAAIIDSVEAAYLRRAGLEGPYARADCALGRGLYEAALEGRGAYLYGEPGTGKTWAAACAVRLWVRSHLGESGGRAWMVTAADLLEGLKRDMDERDPKAWERARRARLLVLDDLGAERPTDWARERLEALLDARLRSGGVTVATSNLRIGELRDLWGGVEGKRMASRLSGLCGKGREVAGPDRRLEGAR